MQSLYAPLVPQAYQIHSRSLKTSKAVRGRDHIPCPKCPSSDGYVEYDDNHGWCYACSTYFTLDKDKEMGSLQEELARYEKSEMETERSPPTSKQFVDFRGIEANTCRRYGLSTEVTEDGQPVRRHYVYPWGGRKVRTLSAFTRKKAGDEFHVIGDMRRRGLFGRQLFDPGSSRTVTIVEGEEDAVSAYQLLNGKSAVVSVQSASSAKEDCVADLEFLNAFDRIYLCLDNDEHGRRATEQIAKLFDYNKVYYVRITRHKDANDYLRAGHGDEFRNIWYAAKRFAPEGIVSSWSEFRDILRKKEEQTLGTYPFEQLQSMARGFREGEVVLIDAQEGIGKTEIVRALEYHLLKSTEHNIGCIHLEESKTRQLLGLAGLELKTPLHLAEGLIDENLAVQTLESITKRDERLHLYSHFGSDDPHVLLGIIRFMVTALNCKFVFLDHITMVVTGLNSDDERRVLDFLSTRLAMLVEEHSFCLVMVSHVNDDGKTRGSRNIAKIADLRISLDRDMENSSSDVRNTTQLLIRKNRFGSITGPADALIFDPTTFTLTEKSKHIKLPAISGVG